MPNHERLLREPLAWQLANLGSEFHRAMRWRGKNDDVFWSEVERFLSMLNAMIGQDHLPRHRKKELLQLREVCCDKFLDAHVYGGSVEGLQAYFDAFAVVARVKCNNTGPEWQVLHPRGIDSECDSEPATGLG